MKPTAAKGTFPFKNHRTVEQVWLRDEMEAFHRLAASHARPAPLAQIKGIGA